MTELPRVTGFLSGLLLVVSGIAGADARAETDTEALRREVEALRAAQAAMQRDLQEIRQLLLHGRTAARADDPLGRTVAVAGAPFMGERDAPLTLIEFSDYQCPYCARHAKETLPQIEQEYVRTGRLRYVMRDLPIASLHPEAFRAHEAVRCAGEQGRNRELRSRIFASQQALGPEALAAHAQALGLDVVAFRSCLSSGRHAAAIRADVMQARKAGVTGTPSFFLGRTTPDDSEIQVLKVIVGAQPFPVFRQAIDGLLARTADAPP